MVFDTSLLAAFDHPGVDPAAQQQAANLLSQQSFQPQSISPPSLPGAGLSEPRPQTVTQGAPYYDPIAIHQGNAPVYYDTYTGPSVDMSNYLGNLFSPSNTGTLNYGPAVGGSGSAFSTSDPTSRYGGTNSTEWNRMADAVRPPPDRGLIGSVVDTITGAVNAPVLNFPVMGTRAQSNPVTIGDLATAPYNAYTQDIPYYSDFARNTLQPIAGGIGSGIFEAAAPRFLDSAARDAGRWTGEALVPVSAGDVALELIPGIGTVPDAWRLASRLAPDATDFANVIRRGGQALDNRLGQIDLRSEVGAIRVPGGTPDPNKMTPENISSISRRLKGGDEKPIFEGIEQAAKQTDVPPASSYIPGTEAYARGKSIPDLPDYSNDPGYWESMAKQADTGGNPARSKPAPVKRTVTMGDGTVVDATDDAIKAAVDRFTRRPTSKKLITADPIADPEGFLDQIAEQVVSTKTRGGRPLMSGVTKEEVKRSLVNISNKVDETFAPSAAPAAPAPPKPPADVKPSWPAELQDDLDHFTKMTRGVIENDSIMQKAYDATRIATRWASGDVADSKIAEIIAREAELRTYLTRDKLDPKLINKAVRNWRMEMLGRYFSGDDLKKAAKFMQQNSKTRMSRDFTDEISDTLKATVLNADFAIAGQQVEAGFRRGSVPIATGVFRDIANRIATKLHMPGAMEVYLRQDMDHVKQAIADGLQMGGGDTANISARGRSLFGRIPKVGGPIETGLDKLADFQYGAVLGTVRLRAYEGLLLQNKVIHDATFGKLGGDITDPLVRRHIAEQANMIGSTSREATQAVRSRAENKLLLTSRMTRAQVNEVITPLKTFRSQEDVINTINLIGSIGVYLGAAKLANDQFGISDFVWNPLESGFGQIKTDVEDKFGRKQILDFMPQDSLITAITRSINAWKDEDWDRLRDSWLRLGAGRLNMLPSDILKFTGYGYDSKGGFHGPDDARMSIKEAAKGAAPIPLTVKDIAGDQSAFNVATAITGQGTFPENESQVKERLAQEKFGRSYNELYNTEKDQVDADAAVQAAEAFNGPTPLDLVGKQKEADRTLAATGQVPEGGVDWLAQSGLKSAAEIDAQLASGEITGAEARAAYQALREELVRRDLQNRESPEVQKQLAEIEKAVAEKGEQSLSPAERAQRDYYAMLDEANASGTFDFDLYNQKLDEWVATYGDQRDLISASREPLSAGEAELKQLRTELDTVGWFDSYDRGFQSMLRTNPDFQKNFGQYATYDDFEAGMKQRIQDSYRRQYGTQYIDQDKIDDTFFKILTDSGLMHSVNVVEAVTLFRNPALIPQIAKWYDLDAGELNILKELQATR